MAKEVYIAKLTTYSKKMVSAFGKTEEEAKQAAFEIAKRNNVAQSMNDFEKVEIEVARHGQVPARFRDGKP